MRQQKTIKFVSSLTVLIILLLAAITPAHAFLFQVQVLDQKEISNLSEKALMDTYLEVLIEERAVTIFYTNSGFTPKEYNQFKELLRYRVYLMMEIQKRKLEVPKIDW